MFHRLIEAIKVTCFGILRRPWLCLYTVLFEKNNLPGTTIGLFHKLISVQDVVHKMLRLHVAQQLPSLKVHAPASWGLLTNNFRHA